MLISYLLTRRLLLHRCHSLQFLTRCAFLLGFRYIVHFVIITLFSYAAGPVYKIDNVFVLDWSANGRKDWLAIVLAGIMFIISTKEFYTIFQNLKKAKRVKQYLSDPWVVMNILRLCLEWTTVGMHIFGASPKIPLSVLLSLEWIGLLYFFQAVRVFCNTCPFSCTKVVLWCCDSIIPV